MAKTTTYYCKNCGNESPKWLGKCPACGEWNTYVEEPKAPKAKGSWHGASAHSHQAVEPVKISEIEAQDLPRITLPSTELNRVLGGGLVPGSMVLIGGEPGIGKSTLVLQNVLRIRSRKVLYVSGEESPQQLRMRADRIAGGKMDCECYLLCDLLGGRSAFGLALAHTGVEAYRVVYVLGKEVGHRLVVGYGQGLER